MVVFTDVSKDVVQKLIKRGFILQNPKTVHEEARFIKKDATLVLYTSGKLLVQGKDQEKVAAELRSLHLGQEVAPEIFRKESGWIIGSDESLKGDTFGGIVVAAVKADHLLRGKLIELGVADSKTLTDAEIIPLAEKIRHLVPCEIRSLTPEEYNDWAGNVTELLNTLHLECARDLLPGKHVVDKYPGCRVGDVIEEKAESKYAEVAAASILARDMALKQLAFLSMQAGFTIPKGSSHVKLALLELQERKLDPKKFLKLHFNNVREFLRH